MPFVDLNCDMGEGCGNDAALVRYITSANIACGYHAGDVDTMKRTVDLAIEHGVAVGAHPGYRDLENFGRTPKNLEPDEIRSLIIDQIGLLAEIASAAGGYLSHVKPHGALYNQSAQNADVAAAVAIAVTDFNSDLVLFGLSGSNSISEAEAVRLTAASEVFADRTYQPDGSLTPRTAAGALITDENVAVRQVIEMVTHGQVRSGHVIVPIIADTVCVHGDGEKAVEIAALINRRLREEGVVLKSVKAVK